MAPTPYTLYYSDSSLCSYMLRYSLAIRGPSEDGSDITVEEKEVDIHFNLDQLSEFYLLNINPKGKVPAITSPALKDPMPDSLVVTNYFAKQFPQLKPSSHAAQIDEMLGKIHKPLPYFILSFGGGHPAQHVLEEVLPKIEKTLERGGDISPEYRKALEYKKTFHSGADLNLVLGSESVEQAETTMRTFLEYVNENLPSAQGWLFGLPKPSAADGHVVALLVRLHDVGRDHLLPEKVKEYAERVESTPEWRGVMNGLETTMCQG